jgi:hypothetical protein
VCLCVFVCSDRKREDEDAYGSSFFLFPHFLSYLVTDTCLVLVVR